MELTTTEQRIKLACKLVAWGFFVQLLSLAVVHPLAFVVFLTVGCPLVAGGVILYLLSLLHA